MIKITCEVGTYNDKATIPIMVHNHWNDNNMVEIEVDGKRYAVKAVELKAAVDNCTNTGRF